MSIELPRAHSGNDTPLTSLKYDLDGLRLSIEVLKVNGRVTNDALTALQAQVVELANSLVKPDACPNCKRRLLSVLEHRNTRRRRECDVCGHRFTTSEFTRL